MYVNNFPNKVQLENGAMGMGMIKDMLKLNVSISR